MGALCVLVRVVLESWPFRGDKKTRVATIPNVCGRCEHNALRSRGLIVSMQQVWVIDYVSQLGKVG